MGIEEVEESNGGGRTEKAVTGAPVEYEEEHGKTPDGPSWPAVSLIDP